MSHGPGSLQRAILRALDNAPLNVLSWEDLKRSFLLGVTDGSFYRAVRGLLKRGEIEEFEQFGERHIALPAGKSREDREILAITNWAVNSIRKIGQARGLPESAIRAILAGQDANDFRYLLFSNEDPSEIPEERRCFEKEAGQDTYRDRREVSE